MQKEIQLKTPRKFKVGGYTVTATIAMFDSRLHRICWCTETACVFEEKCYPDEWAKMLKVL